MLYVCIPECAPELVRKNMFRFLYNRVRVERRARVSLDRAARVSLDRAARVSRSREARVAAARTLGTRRLHARQDYHLVHYIHAEFEKCVRDYQ